MNATLDLLARMDAHRFQQCAWQLSTDKATVTLTIRLDDGSRADLTLLPEDAMTLGDQLIELADSTSRRAA